MGTATADDRGIRRTLTTSSLLARLKAKGENQAEWRFLPVNEAFATIIVLHPGTAFPEQHPGRKQCLKHGFCPGARFFCAHLP
jgi:hypothetical protein